MYINIHNSQRQLGNVNKQKYLKFDQKKENKLIKKE